MTSAQPLTGTAVCDTVLIMTTHGGARAGAGRKSAFDAKAVAAFAMDFTPAGRRALDTLVRRTRLSRNSVIASLALQFADAVAFPADGAAPYPDKSRFVLSIRVHAAAAAKLTAARRRTGRSYSDIGEDLVRRFAPRARFPKPRLKAKC